MRARLASGEALAGTFVKSRDPSTTEALAAGGLDFVIADLEHSPLSVADVESITRAGDQTVLIGQIESIAGVAALPSIIDAGALDALFIGATDLSVSLGHPAQMGHPAVADALSDVAEAIIEAGMPLGIFCGTAAVAAEWAGRGATLLAISSDLTMLSGMAPAILRDLVRARGAP